MVVVVVVVKVYVGARKIAVKQLMRLVQQHTEECATKNKESQFREEKKGMLLGLGMSDYRCNKTKR